MMDSFFVQGTFLCKRVFLLGLTTWQELKSRTTSVVKLDLCLTASRLPWNTFFVFLKRSVWCLLFIILFFFLDNRLLTFLSTLLIKCVQLTTSYFQWQHALTRCKGTTPTWKSTRQISKRRKDWNRIDQNINQQHSEGNSWRKIGRQ